MEVRNTLEPEQRRFILEGLDSLIQMSGKIIPPDLISDNKQRQSSIFDQVTARKIREEAQLSRGQLAEILGFSKYDRDRIQGYESGRVSPHNPPKAEFPRKYIRWLKRKGYNPYNL